MARMASNQHHLHLELASMQSYDDDSMLVDNPLIEKRRNEVINPMPLDNFIIERKKDHLDLLFICALYPDIRLARKNKDNHCTIRQLLLSMVLRCFSNASFVAIHMSCWPSVGHANSA